MDRKAHIAMLRRIEDECRKEREGTHTPLQMKPDWDISAESVLAFRQWLKMKESFYKEMQRETEEMFLKGKTDEDGSIYYYSASAYRQAYEMLEDVIRWGAPACQVL